MTDCERHDARNARWRIYSVLCHVRKACQNEHVAERFPEALEHRLQTLEAYAKLVERVATLEQQLGATRPPALSAPWWRNARAVTMITAIIAAVVPAVTAIEGLFKNQREYERAVLDQQNNIRQTYLDRVLRPGVPESDRLRLFGLLAKLKSDPEFKNWAEEQLRESEVRYEHLQAKVSTLESDNRKLELALNEERTASAAERQRLERQLADGQRVARDLRARIGDGVAVRKILRVRFSASNNESVEFEIKQENGASFSGLTPAILTLERGIYEVLARKGEVSWYTKIDLVNVKDNYEVFIHVPRTTGGA